MKLSSWILKILGWKPIYNVVEPDKSVICVAPHTSNWDFIMGKLYYNALNKKASFLIKKEWFFFPMGSLMKRMGGVPIDRSRKNSVTKQLVDVFESKKYFHVAITPEGTRKPNAKWKLGFYYIALGAVVPIQLAYIDYKKKEMGITEIYYPTGNEAEDLTYIYNYYRGINAKKPDNFIVPIYQKTNKQ